MNTCDTCEHWKGPEGKTYGYCQEILAHRSVAWVGVPEDGATLYGGNGSEIMVTGPKFGCTRFKAKNAEQAECKTCGFPVARSECLSDGQDCDPKASKPCEHETLLPISATTAGTVFKCVSCDFHWLINGNWITRYRPGQIPAWREPKHPTVELPRD